MSQDELAELELWRKTSGVRPEVAFFAVAMEDKLRRHDHKGEKWRTVPAAWLLDRLKDEVAELEEAIAVGNGVEIRREAADVANFSLFISTMFGKDPS